MINMHVSYYQCLNVFNREINFELVKRTTIV